MTVSQTCPIEVGEAFMYAEGYNSSYRRGEIIPPNRHYTVLLSLDPPTAYDADEDIVFLLKQGWERDATGTVGQLEPPLRLRAFATLAKCMADPSLFQYPFWNY